MKQATQKKDTYECEACGATSNSPKECCGKPMKKKGDSGCDCD